MAVEIRLRLHVGELMQDPVKYVGRTYEVRVKMPSMNILDDTRNNLTEFIKEPVVNLLALLPRQHFDRKPPRLI